MLMLISLPSLMVAALGGDTFLEIKLLHFANIYIRGKKHEIYVMFNVREYFFS